MTARTNDEPGGWADRLRWRIGRWRARRRLRNSLASFSAEELERTLAAAELQRRDLFADHVALAPHRRFLARMIGHFGVELDPALGDRWDDLRDADRVCERCGMRRRCHRWFAWARANDAPRVFCPNADLLDDIATRDV